MKEEKQILKKGTRPKGDIKYAICYGFGSGVGHSWNKGKCSSVRLDENGYSIPMHLK